MLLTYDSVVQFLDSFDVFGISEPLKNTEDQILDTISVKKD